MRTIKILNCLLVAMILICSTCSAENKKTVRLVRLPIIFQSNKPNFETCVALETKISRAVHIPMNGTLKLVEQIAVAESTTALSEIWRDMRAKNKKSQLKDAMKPLAKKLNADIVVCPILQRYSERYIREESMHLETHLISNVSATLIVYDRRTDELVKKKAVRNFNNSANKFGKASYLAEECFDTLINETNLRRKFLEIK